MNPYNDFFDKIFIVNLDERKDRWDEIQKELNKFGVTNIERYSAIKPDVSDIPINFYNKLVSPWKQSPKYIQGCMGCKMSHYNIVKLARERNYNKILILEDDMQFIHDKEENIKELNTAITNVPNNWHLLYLSGNHIHHPENIKENIYKINHTLTTHAYAIHSNIFEYILETMMETGCELDNYYIEKIQQQGKSYTIKPGLATQSPSYSNVLHRRVDFRNVIS